MLSLIPIEMPTSNATGIPDLSQSRTSGEGRIRCRRGASILRDTRAAITEIRDQVEQAETELLALFVSPDHDLVAVAAALAAWPANQILACTTAGEIGPLGAHQSGISAVSFSGALTAELHDLGNTSPQAIEGVAHRIRASTELSPLRHSVCVVLHDGLAGCEERVNAELQDSLAATRVVGGSTGDNLRFRACHVFSNGSFQDGKSVAMHLMADSYLEPFKIQHFAPGSDIFVVTAALPEERRVLEINGLPAITYYEMMTGVHHSRMGPETYAMHPIVIELDGEVYVRSIRSIQPDGSILLYCAIEEGIIATIGRSTDALAAARSGFQRITDRFGPPAAILGFDCILRGMSPAAAATAEIYRQHKVTGFYTYGESFGRLHMNQTFTGLAIGKA